MFGSDYPRGAVNCFWLWWFPAFDTFSIAAALPVPFLVAHCALTISLLCLPPRPLPRRRPAALTAISLASLPGMKILLAPFE